MGLLLILRPQNVFVFPKNLRASRSRFLEDKVISEPFPSGMHHRVPISDPKNRQRAEASEGCQERQERPSPPISTIWQNLECSGAEERKN